MQTDKPAQPQRSVAFKRIGRYRIVRPLSKGGMALVYEARRESLAGVSPRVAIKLILPEHANSETFKQLFINEARLGASMQHQNLVQIQDFDSEPGVGGQPDTYFLVMEYVEGITLRKVIALAERNSLSVPMGVIAEVGRQACDGLHYAHTASDDKGQLQLVHRDMKPSNLILSPHGVVKVLDFGISKGRLRHERQGSVKGTWGYMAPEQAVGAEIQGTADVFGLATVLYELASLRPMFMDRGKEEIRRLLKDDHAARMAATLDGPAYGALIGVLVRALQRDPAARYASAEAFGRALSSLLPDPITARDEVVRFYQEIEGMGPRTTPSPTSRGQSGGSSAITSNAASLAPPPQTRQRSNRVNGIATFVAGATISFALLGGAAVIGLALVGGAARTAIGEPTDPLAVPMAEGTPPSDDPILAVDEPPGPAGVGAPGEERPPPLDGRRTARPSPRPTPSAPAPDPEDEVVTIVKPEGTPDEAPPAAPTADGPTGTLIIDAKQGGEVYIAGQFVDQAPVKKDLPIGTYAVSLVAADGRRRTFEVKVEADTKIKKVWDFDRMEWR